MKMSRRGGLFYWPFIDIVVLVCTINESEGKVYLKEKLLIGLSICD